MYLFAEYTSGTILLKNRAHISVYLNYDTANRNMMYMDNQNEMILDATNGVDTIYIDKRKFIPNTQKGYLEIVFLKNGVVFINWTSRQHLRGKKGAYGQIMQGSVQTLDINTIKEQSGIVNSETTDVYTQLYENECWVLREDKFIKCNNEKSLLKLFPGKEKQIKAYIKERKIEFRNTQQAVEAIDYCLGISK